MHNLKSVLQASLIGSAICGALVLAGCRPHRDHHHGDGHGSGDLANLHDDGGHHDDDTAIPGYLYAIGGDVENDGDDWSGSFRVDFYASVNNTITTSDYFIGSEYVGSIAPGGWANADLLEAFPNIPPGRYYVGWILDAGHGVSESNESDNVVVLSGPSLLVEDEFEPNDHDYQSHYLGGPNASYSLQAAISEDGDEDWFSFWQDDGFQVEVLLSSLPANYDVEVYDDGGSLISFSSSSGTSSESVTFTAGYSGFFYIRVFGFGSAHDEDNTYDLDVNLE